MGVSAQRPPAGSLPQLQDAAAQSPRSVTIAAERVKEVLPVLDEVVGEPLVGLEAVRELKDAATPLEQ